MKAEHRTPEEIERDIERDRARMTDHMRSLQDQFSLDGAIRSVSNQLRQHGGDLGESVSRTVRDNPAALALTGIGLAWLIFGGGNSSKDKYEYGRRTNVSTADPRLQRGPYGRLETRDMEYRGAPVPEWADDDEDFSSRMSEKGREAQLRAQGAAQRAGEKMGEARAAAESSASRASGRMAEGRDAAMQRARELRQRLSRGTEHMSEEARARVVAAREAAVTARRRASRMMAESSEQASEFFERQPLVAGALAAALGAAIGGALPRTRKEDELMGIHSDWLMDEAERIYHEESAKAAEVVEAATDEAKKIAQEKKSEMDNAAPGEKSAADAAADEAKSAGKRVADAASQKAKEKDVGKVSS